MLKNVKLGLLAFAMGATLVACQNESSDSAADATATADATQVANQQNLSLKRARARQRLPRGTALLALVLMRRMQRARMAVLSFQVRLCSY